MRETGIKMGLDKMLAMGMKKMCAGAVNASMQTTCAFFMAQPKRPEMLKNKEKIEL